MTMFRCNRCNQEYEDYYPPDDTCLKCKKGTVFIIIVSGRAFHNGCG
jgi:DNA polymerase II large subunit